MHLGQFTPVAPVVLAPMAGVTNAPFRALCREFAPGLVYVNEMVMAAAVVHGNSKTERMMTFAADEAPRSLQLYGSDPRLVGEAVRKLCGEGRIDHLDMNFGYPAAKVSRKGGAAAVPAKPNLLRAILSAAVAAAGPYGVPVTIKFRKGIDDNLLTFVTTGRIAAEVSGKVIQEREGSNAVVIHDRQAIANDVSKHAGKGVEIKYVGDVGLVREAGVSHTRDRMAREERASERER